MLIKRISDATFYIFEGVVRPRQKTARLRTRRFLPTVESLEDRVVPTVVTWTGLAGDAMGAWSNPANWSTGKSPVAGDDVVFDGTGHNNTSTVDIGFEVAELTVESSWAGTINVVSSLSVDAAFTLAGGTFGGNGAVTLGDMDGGTHAIQAGSVLIGSGGWTNEGQLRLGGSAISPSVLDLDGGVAEARGPCAFVMTLLVIILVQVTRRTGDHISTMKQVIIMTTNIRKIVSPDLFVENDSILFDRRRAAALVESVSPLGAITLVNSESASETLGMRAIACGRGAVSLVSSVLGTDYRLWLFVADGPWKHASRITSHHKLWKNHRDLVEYDAVLKIGDEIEIVSDGLIRYAGLLEISCNSCDKAINSVRTNASFSMIFSKRPNVDSAQGVRSIFSSAFPKKDGVEQVAVDWLSLALGLCPQSDILIRVSGLFDDREAAVDVIATEGTILTLRHVIQE
jgi:hypothetical protein